jgi:hypothetical protein
MEIVLPGVREPESLQVRTRELPDPQPRPGTGAREGHGGITDAAAALRYAEAGGITGKVELIPEKSPSPA